VASVAGSDRRHVKYSIAAEDHTSPPQTTLTNGLLDVLVYLPDGERGFFRGTRFDWAGVVGHLEFDNHVFYQKWFTRMDPGTLDWIADQEVVAGPNTAITGPVEEFKSPLGYDEAAPGSTFVKVGVGALEKPGDGSPYHAMRLYRIVDHGRRMVQTRPDHISFTHELTEPNSGYSYAYAKALQLTPGRAEMTLAHTLRNTGTRRIDTAVYNHNFLALDSLTTGPEFVVKAPYAITSDQPPDRALAEIRDREVVYLRPLAGNQVVSTPLTGFGPTAADYDFRVEHLEAGVGVRITGDRAMSHAYLWSMRTTIAVEPFIAIGIDPGEEFSWTLTYNFYRLGA
jgi:hypothetical protein